MNHDRKASRGTVRIGISGWRYAPWRGVFYPEKLAQRLELSFASQHFPTIELNGSFYALQRPSSYARWYDDTPSDFVFSVKAPRYITHMRRLRDVRLPLANFLASGVFRLREKLGPVLWQFPPSFAFDAALFGAFLDLLPTTTDAAVTLARSREARMNGRAALAIDASRPLRHAVEVRHASFDDPAFFSLLEAHNVAIVVADTAGKWPLFERRTADFVYVRLHGDKVLYSSGYTPAALARWKDRIDDWARDGDVFAYFDNDQKVMAPRDAQRLIELLDARR